MVGVFNQFVLAEQLITGTSVLTTKVWPVQFDDWFPEWLGRLCLPELGLVISVRGVRLADQLRYQFLNLIVVQEVLFDLVDDILIGTEAVEWIGQFVVVVFIVLTFLKGHVGLEVPVSQLQQLVVLLKFALVFLEQFVVQVLVVHRCIVHRDVQANHVHLPVVRLLQFLQVFSY